MAVNPHPLINVHYDENNWIGIRIYDQMKFALKKEIGDRSGDRAPNWIEKSGDYGLWFVEGLPKKVCKVITDPRFVSLALGILAFGLISVAFYPATTVLVVKAGIALLPQIPFWAVKFSTYLLACETLFAAILRSQGRFWNEPLKDAYYNQKMPDVAPKNNVNP